MQVRGVENIQGVEICCIGNQGISRRVLSKTQVIYIHLPRHHHELSEKIGPPLIKREEGIKEELGAARGREEKLQEELRAAKKHEETALTHAAKREGLVDGCLRSITAELSGLVQSIRPSLPCIYLFADSFPPSVQPFWA